MASPDPAPKQGFPRAVLGVIERLGNKAFNTGNGHWWAIAVVVAIISWKLESPDLKDVLVKVAAAAGWLGYPVAILAIYGSANMLSWREKHYKAEIERLQGNMKKFDELQLPGLAATPSTKPGK